MTIWKMSDYRNKAGERSLSTQIHIRDMGGTTSPISENIRIQARRAARPLQDALVDLAERQAVQRNLVSGARLDPRKRHDVALALRRGHIDLEELRPYQRRTLTLDLPTIGVVASCGVDEVNANKHYVKNITLITLGIAWACETVGVDVRAFLMESHLKRLLVADQPYREAMLAFTLIEPGVTTPLSTYSTAMNRYSFYGSAFATAYSKDMEFRRMCARLVGKHHLGFGGPHLSANGGDAVHWIRTIHQPDIVIGLGKLTDLKDADIQLHNTFQVEEAITQIVQQIKGNKS